MELIDGYDSSDFEDVVSNDERDSESQGSRESSSSEVAPDSKIHTNKPKKTSKKVHSDVLFIAAHLEEFISDEAKVNPLQATESNSNSLVKSQIEVDSGESSSSDSESEEDVNMDCDEASVSSDTDVSDDPVAGSRDIKGKATDWLTEEEQSVPVGPPRTKHELEEAISVLPSTEAVDIDLSTERLKEVGKVLYRITHECSLVIQASYTTDPLDEGSLLFTAEGRALGAVSEVFGPVTEPFYVVRWANPSKEMTTSSAVSQPNNKNKRLKKQKNNSVDKREESKTEKLAADSEVEPVSEEAATAVEQDKTHTSEVEITTQEGSSADVVQPEMSQEKGEPLAALVAPDTSVWVSEKKCKFLMSAKVRQLMSGKGSDASNMFDEEPKEEELEFSDDEKEQQAKQQRKMLRTNQKHAVVDGADTSKARSNRLSTIHTNNRTSKREKRTSNYAQYNQQNFLHNPVNGAPLPPTQWINPNQSQIWPNFRPPEPLHAPPAYAVAQCLLGAPQVGPPVFTSFVPTQIPVVPFPPQYTPPSFHPNTLPHVFNPNTQQPNSQVAPTPYNQQPMTAGVAPTYEYKPLKPHKNPK